MIDIFQLNDGNKEELINNLNARNDTDFKIYNVKVQQIIDDVRGLGDKGLLQYTKQYDHVELKPEELRVTKEEIEAAYQLVDEAYTKAIRLAIEKIKAFHLKQKEKSWVSYEEKGIVLGQKITPIEKVGIYVPGGTAAYPSSVLMNGIPAIVAGVERIVMVTPPNKKGEVNPGVLVAANELGLKEIYKVGGGQAIAALAYGTETIPKVDKIVGPGNIYVATAKRLVYGQVDIDMIAGPSEILVIADEEANPRFVAADLLSQAEHDELASAICITTSKEVAEGVKEEILRQTEGLERREIIEKSLIDFGGIFIVANLEEAVELSNIIAPEHLELAVKNPFELLSEIKNAGAIFLGNYSPEPLGDYMAGPNHVLPTNGTARFFSPLEVKDFIKKSSIVYYNQAALAKVKDEIMVLAEQEGLTAHKNSMKVRFEDDDQYFSKK
ncbi:histidinol dehydrogenase [Alkaliphilus transvaalensis]|uniref:histidinol dehydrogenase n=1 Tax=Alkaliphilus transvaalensis TaxID=114628 RepID=UPI00047A66D8|nr:histidinol dehydrogenase [Alkaliphilus transvaalensis]